MLYFILFICVAAPLLLMWWILRKAKSKEKELFRDNGINPEDFESNEKT